MKILIICPYPIDTAPGQRFKYEQYINFLEKKGYQIKVSSFFSSKTYLILQKKGSTVHPEILGRLWEGLPRIF